MSNSSGVRSFANGIFTSAIGDPSLLLSCGANSVDESDYGILMFDEKAEWSMKICFEVGFVGYSVKGITTPSVGG